MLATVRQLTRKVSGLRAAHRSVDYSKVPQLSEKDLEETFTIGGGPGGQAVAKTANCVLLKHLPTGIVVKCHQTRLQETNRKIARQLLITKLDNLINGSQSVDSQIKEIKIKKSVESERRRRRLRDLKKAWKEQEPLS